VNLLVFLRRNKGGYEAIRVCATIPWDVKPDMTWHAMTILLDEQKGTSLLIHNLMGLSKRDVIPPK